MATSENISQVYTNNPSTTAADADLFYIGKSPYGITDDSAIEYVDLQTQVYNYVAANLPIPTGSPLTEVNDTNVTLTLGGSPSTALVNAASITVGWAGLLPGSRGGTGVNNGSSTATYAGNLNFANSFTTSGNFSVTQTYTGSTNVTFPTTGTLATTTNLASYLPLTGGTLSGSLTLPVLNILTTTSTSSGVIDQAGGSIFHTYSTGGNQNLFLGASSGNFSLTTSNENTGLGNITLTNLTTGNTNTAVGSTSLFSVTSGAANTSIGRQALSSLTTGLFNIGIGVSAGSAYTGSESSNILIGNAGVLGESHVARIGTTGLSNGQITTMFLAGNVNGNGGLLATTSQIPTGAALTKADDTNVTLTLGGSPTTALINATSITAGWTGQLALTRGGTNASLTASNGGIVYSTASALAILSGTATAGQMLQSGSSTTPAWSTTTYPATNVINTLLYASSANVMSALATANNGTLITSAGGVPSISSTLPSAVQNNITAVNSAANTLSIGGGVKTFGSGALNIASSTGPTSWTPGFAFGGATTGITYSFQSGTYCTTVMPNGQIKVECWAAIGLSNKGSATGNATITGFPVATGTSGNIYIFASTQENISSSAGVQLYCDMTASSTVASVRAYNNAVGNTPITNTNFTNTSAMKFYACYWNN